jgi:predicted nucleic acid-binding protein
VSFIDANVLVYATARNAPFRDQARAALSRLAVDEPLAVSRQILREDIAVMTRQEIWGKALTLIEAAADAATFVDRFTVLEDGPAVWDRLIERQQPALAMCQHGRDNIGVMDLTTSEGITAAQRSTKPIFGASRR